MTKSVCPGLSTFNIHLTIHCLSTEGNICCAVSGNPNQPNLSIWGMLFGGVWYNIWSNSTIYVCCVVSSTALLQVVMLARIVFEQSQFSPAISVLTGKANYLTGKLSSPVWGKLLGEGLDPPGVALLAQNVVVQGVAPEWMCFSARWRICQLYGSSWYFVNYSNSESEIVPAALFFTW